MEWWVQWCHWERTPPLALARVPGGLLVCFALINVPPIFFGFLTFQSWWFSPSGSLLALFEQSVGKEFV